MPERPVAFASRDGAALEGRLHAPSGTGPHPAVVVCHPHPLMGGTMHDRVVLAVVRALVARDVIALRFNFRREYGQGVAEQGDVAGALDFLTDQPAVVRDRLALAGYSFGAGVIARHASEEPRAQALALIALPGEYLNPTLLAGDERPLCIVVGDRDPVSPVSDVRAWAARLSTPPTLHVLPHTDHFFGRGLEHMASLVADFLADRIGAP